MPLEPLRIVKNWLKRTTTREENWDEIADKVGAFASRVNNNLKQLGLDLNGATYDFNNTGVATQTTSVLSRVSTLENQVTTAVGAYNIGLDLTSTSIVKLAQADGSALSATNPATIVFNSKSSPGQIVERSLTAFLQATLTGAHWGFDGLGDLTDQKLYILLIDDAGTLILGVDVAGTRQTVTTADAEAVATSVTTASKVLVSSEPSAESNCVYVGWVKANFDDTGNAGGENFWTIQSGAGDIFLSQSSTAIRNRENCFIASFSVAIANGTTYYGSAGTATDGRTALVGIPRNGSVVSASFALQVWQVGVGAFTSDVTIIIRKNGSTFVTLPVTTVTAIQDYSGSVIIPSGTSTFSANDVFDATVTFGNTTDAGAHSLAGSVTMEVELDS